LLLAFFWLGTGQLQAQLLEHLRENHWTSAQVSSQSFEQASDYIGNHPCLKLQNNRELQSLKKIARETSGTLFLVAKLKVQLSQATVLELGGLQIRADSIFCGGIAIGAHQLTEAPFLLKIEYQNGYLRKWNKQQLFASEHLALAEVIHYKEQLNAEQSRQIESYLALKYSINITHNNNPALRDYEALNGSQYWADASDGMYNEEVLSLGRIDQWNWQQSQTMSADSRSILLSMAPNMNLGTQPKLTLADGSVLVVSKRAIELDQQDCKTSPHTLPWKFNFHNWKSEAQNLFLSWDAAEVVPQAPYFSDGNTKMALEYTLEDGKIIVKVPLQEVQTSAKETWFLVWNPSPLSCQPLGALDILHCQTVDEGTNQIQIEIDGTQLPADFVLKDTRSGLNVKGIIESEYSLLQHIPGGQYQLFISSKEQNLFEEVLQFDNCNKGEENQLSNVSLSSLPRDAKTEEEGLSQHFANDAISLFPNPIKGSESITAAFGSDLLGTSFEIEILDQAGKTLSTSQFTPGPDRLFQTEQLTNPGTYFIQFKSASSLVVKKVVVL